MREDIPVITIVLIMFGLIVFGVVLEGGPSYTQTLQTLEKHGFTDVRPGELTWFACSESDYPGGREFLATNAQGRTVSGVVCCGVFKRCTVRY